MKTLAIREENRYPAERRAPLVPIHVSHLIQEGYRFLVESSKKRIFSDEEYARVGANVTTDLSDAEIIIGIKEIPVENILHDKTYMFFSHVIKGQPHNMPMLRKILESKSNLIDYEKITDDLGKRLIFFGKYAGYAGFINTLWTVGQVLQLKGIETPLTEIKQTHHYPSLALARKALSHIAFELVKKGLPRELQPFVIGITGYGNVSQGVQELLHLLPCQEILPETLLDPSFKDESGGRLIYFVVFKEEDMVRRKTPSDQFDLTHYYQYPEEYESKFYQYLEKLTVLIHGSYWDNRYPRVVSKSELKHLFESNQRKLIAIGDISCDPHGGVEATPMGTPIENPVLTYDPLSGEYEMGIHPHGIPIMAVDILPSELPYDASVAFSHMLKPFIPYVVSCNFSKSFHELDLIPSLKKALIVHAGELTPPYKYLEKYL
ncbi:MAG: hypothetical protein N2Z72_07950 [Bacteroidales bacterium]|nr:hypothetical protein [Bacteroidales bacterium]